MALLPKVPWTDIDDFRVAVDAPVSTDLMTDIVVDLNYLKAVVTDGALAPQGITCAVLDAYGNAVINGDLNVTGALSVGAFADINTALIFSNI